LPSGGLLAGVAWGRKGLSDI